MPDPGVPLEALPPQQAIQRARARAAFTNLSSAIHEAVRKHNDGGGALLELQVHDDRLEVYQQGLIFPSLRVAMDALGVEMTYYRPARSPKETTAQGSIVPGHDEKVLVIDEAGVAHRIGCPDLARFLLRAAQTTPPSGKPPRL